MMNPPDIPAMFDPEGFRSNGHTLVDMLAEYLDRNMCAQNDVLSLDLPQIAAECWREPLPLTGRMTTEAFVAMLREGVLAKSLHVHHPRSIGHQVAPPLPIAALCDLVAALTNQAMAVYETGPSATMLERQVLQWLAELIGFQASEGVLTSGGAQANLTALLAARQCKAGGDVWKDGVAGAGTLRILACEHAHYSVSRAAGIMGLGTRSVISVAADAAGGMDVVELQQAWADSISRGEHPFVVVASAGCTPTGSIDPLNLIADFCEAHYLWLHVDGAHGASGLLTDHYHDALVGIDRADSVVWDGHKLLYMPATVSAVLFRNPKHSYAAFSQEASYLFHGGSDEDEAYNTSYRTLECTKRMMGLKLWAAFVLYGRDGLGSLVEHVYGMARQFSAMLDAADDFELLMPPQTNIVCFRYLGRARSGAVDMNTLQATLRRQLVDSGTFHLTQTSLRDEIWLRTTIMNPLTRQEDLLALMIEIRGAARQLGWT